MSNYTLMVNMPIELSFNLEVFLQDRQTDAIETNKVLCRRAVVAAGHKNHGHTRRCKHYFRADESFI